MKSLWFVAGMLLSWIANAEIAISANEHKVTNENGVTKNIANPTPDTITVMDIGVMPPKAIATLNVPTSVVGPPLSVAITRDETLALVAAATKIDPADATKTVPDNKLSVIDLKASPPKVVATLEAGAGASGVSVNRDGTLALVANRNEGTVSVFGIKGATVTPINKVKIGEANSGPSHAVFTPDGKRALVTRDGDHAITVLAIDGDKVTATDRTFHSGIRPYAIDISADGRIAFVGNVGRGAGDVDTVSLIDMSANPPRTVDHLTVGATTEAVKLAPNGQYGAAIVHNGTARATNSPFYNPNGKLVLVSVTGGALKKIAEAPIGKWSQGVAFTKDSKTILVQNMVEKDIQIFSFDGVTLKDTGTRIKLPGGGAAIRTSENY